MGFSDAMSCRIAAALQFAHRSRPTIHRNKPPKAHMTTMQTVVNDFTNLLSEAEDLLKRAGSETGEQARVLQMEIENKLLDAKLRLRELEGQAVDSAKAVKAATESYVQENPWQAVGIAAAVGLVAGLLIARR